MESTRRSYGRTVKVHAVKRIVEDGHCPHHVAADLDINTEQLRNWIHRYATPAGDAVSRLRLKTPTDELQELRRESESLKREQEIFRTILGYSERTTP